MIDKILLSTHANSVLPFYSVDSDPNLQAQALELWQKNKTGPLTALVRDDHFAWIRVPDKLLEEFEDPSSGPTAGHIEMLIGVRCTLNAVLRKKLNVRSQSPTGKYWDTRLRLSAPASRGCILLCRK